MIDPLRLAELPHPIKASRRADLQAVLVLNVVVYKNDSSWLLETRSGEVWMPVKQMYYNPGQSHPRGIILWVPKWLCDKRFGVIKQSA